MSTVSLKLGLPVLIAGVVGISFSATFVQLSEIGPSATAVYRLAFALPPLLLWMKLDQGRAPTPLTRRDWFILMLAGLFFAGDLITWHYSIRLTGVANATFLAHLAPMVVTLGAWLMFKERITRGFVLGLAVSIAGAALLMGADLSSGSGDLLGNILGVGTAIFYGAYLLTIKQLRARLPTATIMAVTSVISLPPVFLYSLSAGESFVPESLFGWGVLLGIALISHAGGQSLIAQAFRYLPAAYASVTLLGTPVFAALIAWIVLGEQLGALQILGCGILLAGILISQRLARIN